MNGKFILILFLAVVSLCEGINVKVREEASATVTLDGKRTHFPVQIKEDVFCVTGLADSTHREMTLCSFDSGASFTHINDDEFCGSKGLSLNGNLQCLREEQAEFNGKRITFPSVIYIPSNGRFQPTEGESITFDLESLNFIPNRVVVGSSTYVAFQQRYFCAATVYGDNHASSILLRSLDGLTWSYVSDLPFTNDQIFIFTQGSFIGVSSGYEANYQLSYSMNHGETWNSPRVLRSLALPQAATFSSGLIAESGTSNLTSSEVKLSFHGLRGRDVISVRDHHKHIFPRSPIEDSSDVTVVGTFPNESEDIKSLAILYQVCTTERCTVYSLHAELDDSAEIKQKKSILEEKEKKDAAKRKAAKEARERQRKQREEREKQKLATQKKFEAYDQPFIASANEYKEQDDEMIIVRKVSPEFIENEKETFYL